MGKLFRVRSLLSSSWHKQGLVNIWRVPYIRLSHFESYIKSYASKADRVQMGTIRIFTFLFMVALTLNTNSLHYA